MYDLIVIGAGPAGTSAAITAAQGGASVLLFDRGKFPRHKVCGEFVSAESLSLLRKLLSQQYRALLDDSLRIPRARLFLEGRVLEAPVNPAAASIARFDLDSALGESAAAIGGDIRYRSAVTKISGTGPFRVTTAEGEYESRALVNASGRWSNLRGASTDPPTEKWLGVKGHFAEIRPENSVDLYFFEGGYCGVQPVTMAGIQEPSGRVNACAVVRADVALTLAQLFSLNPALQQRSLGWQPLSEPVSTSPLIFGKPQPKNGGVLNVGDAAAFVDPFVGDGISLALRGGALVAECLLPALKGHASLQEAGAQYEALYERRFGPVFRTSSKLRKLLRMPQAVRRPLVSVLAHAPAVTEFLVSRTR